MIIFSIFLTVFFNFALINGLDQNETTTKIKAKIVEKSYEYADPKTEGGIDKVEFQEYILRQPHLVPEKARNLFVKPNKEQLSYIEAAKKNLLPFKQLHEKAFDGATESHRGAIVSIRILASLGDPLIHDQIVQENFLPLLVNDLGKNDDITLQVDALWTLANIASSNSKNAMAIVKTGAIKPLIKCLQSNNNVVREVSVTALGNLMGNGREVVEACHNAGLLPALIELTNNEIERSKKTQKDQILKEISRAMFYFVNEAPPAFYNQDFENLFKVLHELLKSDNFEIVSNAAWTFMGHRNVAKVESEILPLFISYFDRDDPYISYPVLAVLGTITNTEKAVELFTPDVLKHIKNLYNADYEQLKNAVMLFFTRFILADNDQEYRRQAVFNIGVIDMALENLDDPTPMTQETSLFLLSHLVTTDDSKVFDDLIRTPKFLEKLTNCLDNRIDDKYSNQLMSVILLLIHRSTDQNYAIKKFHKYGMIEKLQNLKSSSSDKEVKFLAHVLPQLIKDGITKEDNVILVIPKFVFSELAEIRYLKKMTENEMQFNQHEEL